LHTEAKTKEWDPVLASVTRGVDFSFCSTNAKSAGNKNAGYVSQLVVNDIRDGFSINKFEIDSAVFARGGMRQRFIDALVRIAHVHVFADDRDLHAFVRANDAVDEFLPIFQIGFGRFKAKKVANQLV